MAGSTPIVMIHLEANTVREPLVCKALKASLWLLRILEAFLCSRWRLGGTEKGTSHELAALWVCPVSCGWLDDWGRLRTTGNGGHYQVVIIISQNPHLLINKSYLSEANRRHRSPILCSLPARARVCILRPWARHLHVFH